MDEIKKKLIEFRNCNKVKNYHHLHPIVGNSNEDQKKIVNDEMSRCCDELSRY
jgi:hypothetical protein